METCFLPLLHKGKECVLMGHRFLAQHPGASPGREGERCVCAAHSAVCDSLRAPWTVAHQAFPSMGFSRQGYWSGLPFPPPGALPDPGIKSAALALQVNSIPLWCM